MTRCFGQIRLLLILVLAGCGTSAREKQLASEVAALEAELDRVNVRHQKLFKKDFNHTLGLDRPQLAVKYADVRAAIIKLGAEATPHVSEDGTESEVMLTNDETGCEAKLWSVDHTRVWWAQMTCSVKGVTGAARQRGLQAFADWVVLCAPDAKRDEIVAMCADAVRLGDESQSEVAQEFGQTLITVSRSEDLFTARIKAAPE